jgi:hypothetical protein
MKEKSLVILQYSPNVCYTQLIRVKDNKEKTFALGLTELNLSL